jgi:FlaA1/EpsC-like NDP-sugar epimerase
MTIPEASNLVLQAAKMSKGGEVFILDMGEQLKIYDLAKKLIHLSGRNIAEPGKRGIEIIEVGLRPGEKMYEELLIAGEKLSTSNPKIFKSMEEFPQPEVLEPIMVALREAIGSNDHEAIVNLFNSHVEGYHNAS